MAIESGIRLDGIDIKTTYGIIAIRGSYNDLVRLPDMKETNTYSWPDEHYEDAYLINRKVASRDISLTFLMSAVNQIDLLQKRLAFFNALKADGIRELHIESLNQSYNIWYKGCESAQYINATKQRVKMVLKFRLNSI